MVSKTRRAVGLNVKEESMDEIWADILRSFQKSSNEELVIKETPVVRRIFDNHCYSHSTNSKKKHHTTAEDTIANTHCDMTRENKPTAPPPHFTLQKDRQQKRCL